MFEIATTYTKNHLLKNARNLASKLNLPLIEINQPKDPFQYLLTVTEKRLELRENSTKKSNPTFVDFLSPKLQYRLKHGGKKKELIAKAIGLKNKKDPFVLDATAGFGTDAFIMASLGCRVLMLEKSPIIGALLEDGLNRFKTQRDSNLELSLKLANSSSYISEIIEKDLERPDIIYLDPMYPKKTKSALNKKSMRTLFEIVGYDDKFNLLSLSLKCAKDRVVVKRPDYAEHLENIKPDIELSSGRNSRYDIYILKSKKGIKNAINSN